MDKVLKFQASWCGPCKALSMTLLNEDIGVPVEEVDVDSNREMAIQYGVRGVPTMVYVRDDQEVARFTGVKPLDEIRKWVDNYK